MIRIAQARHKYGTAPKADRTHRGRVYASKREMKRWVELELMEKAGEIRELEYQPRYPMIVGGVLVTTYVADSRYTKRDGTAVVEDVKGVRTREYKIKKKLLKGLYGIEVLET